LAWLRSVFNVRTRGWCNADNYCLYSEYMLSSHSLGRFKLLA
jgi:hypothetical protein